MARRRRGPLLAGAAGAVLVIAGLVVSLTGRGPAGFGWFACAPLSQVSFTPPWAVVWTQLEAVGAGLVVLGLLVASAVAGYAVGRRRADR